MKPGSRTDRIACRRSLLWRLHLWAALIASPFVLLACLTGLLYVLTPQIEAVVHRALDNVQAAPPGAVLRPLDESVRAAEQAAPSGWRLHSVLPPLDASASVRVVFTPPANGEAGKPVASPDPAVGKGDGHGHGGSAAPPASAAAPAPVFLRPNFGLPGQALVVYVDPYSAQVLGQLPESQRFSNWSRKLHSSLQQGEGWRWMIELGASWMMVMIVTGLYLWWPRGEGVLPQAGLRGRAAWRQWHAFLGVVLSLLTLVMVTTGLTWSKHSGAQVRWARDVTGQAPPRIPAQFKSQLQEGAQRLSWDAAWQAVRNYAPVVPLQIMPPIGQEGVWRANHLEKTGQPARRFDLLLDAYSGLPLYYSGWSDQTAFAKATAIGIPFHRGEFGLWNQAVLIVFGLGVIFSLVSGWTMLLKRRAAGSPWWPTVQAGAWRSVSPWAWLGGLLMLAAMPLLALSAVPVALIELASAWRGSARRA
jgi:uncharacterized iron-regulated membrane protein